MKAAAISSKAISHLHIAPRLGGGRSIGSAKLVFDGGESLTYHLTPRELEVLSLLCEGLPNKLIARRLNISAGTVKIHVGKILNELGVSSRLQAVVAAHRCGLVQQLDSRQNEAAYECAPPDRPAYASHSRELCSRAA